MLNATPTSDGCLAHRTGAVYSRSVASVNRRPPPTPNDTRTMTTLLTEKTADCFQMQSPVVSTTLFFQKAPPVSGTPPPPSPPRTQTICPVFVSNQGCELSGEVGGGAGGGGGNSAGNLRRRCVCVCVCVCVGGGGAQVGQKICGNISAFSMARLSTIIRVAMVPAVRSRGDMCGASPRLHSQRPGSASAIGAAPVFCCKGRSAACPRVGCRRAQRSPRRRRAARYSIRALAVLIAGGWHIKAVQGADTWKNWINFESGHVNLPIGSTDGGIFSGRSMLAALCGA